MSSLFEALYARLGRRHVHAFALTYAVGCVALTVLSVIIFSIYQPMSARKFAEVLAVAETGMVASLVLGTRRLRRTTWRPLQLWLDRDRPPELAAAAWRSALGFPLAGVRIQLPYAVVLAALPAALFVGQRFDLPVQDTVLFALGMLIAATYPTVLCLLICEAWLRPIARDAARAFDAAPMLWSWRLSLAERLLLVLVVSAMISAGFVSVGASAVSDATITDLTRSIGLAAGIGLAAAALLVPLVSDVVLFPIRSLTETARRVAAGEPGEPARPLTDDELGTLAGAFNLTVAALAERAELRARAARLRVEALEREQRAEEEIRAAVERERARIAGELHTLLTDDVAALLAHADRAANALAGGDRAGRELAAIEDDGRRVLTELRSFLGALRASEPAGTEPQPGVEDLDELLRAARAAGAEVTERRHALERLPRGVELSAYRIVQDVLADALAGGQLRVLALELGRDGDDLALAVRVDGGVEPGAGVRRARDRVELLGGAAEVSRSGEALAFAARLPLEAPA